MRFFYDISSLSLLIFTMMFANGIGNPKNLQREKERVRYLMLDLYDNAQISAEKIVCSKSVKVK